MVYLPWIDYYSSYKRVPLSTLYCLGNPNQHHLPYRPFPNLETCSIRQTRISANIQAWAHMERWGLGDIARNGRRSFSLLALYYGDICTISAAESSDGFIFAATKSPSRSESRHTAYRGCGPQL